MSTPLRHRQPAIWAQARLHIGPDGTVFRYQPGDEYILNGQCPNRHGPTQLSPAGQRCPVCGYSTNIKPAAPAP